MGWKDWSTKELGLAVSAMSIVLAWWALIAWAVIAFIRWVQNQ